MSQAAPRARLGLVRDLKRKIYVELAVKTGEDQAIVLIAEHKMLLQSNSQAASDAGLSFSPLSLMLVRCWPVQDYSPVVTASTRCTNKESLTWCGRQTRDESSVTQPNKIQTTKLLVKLTDTSLKRAT